MGWIPWVDSVAGVQAGVHWLPAGLRSPGCPPRSPPDKMLLLRGYFCFRGWTPAGVDSQKNRSDASDAPRLAPQHTFSPGKEPENNGLAVWLSPVRLPLDPKNRRHPRTPSTACRSSFEPSGLRSGFRFGLWGPPRHPSRNRLRWRSSARASPEHIQFIHSGTGFCPFEKCPADTFLSRTIPYAAPASLITSCFDRLRLNRRLLRRSEMTESP